MITALLEDQAEIERKDIDGETPLHYAAASTTGLASVAALINHGANLDALNKTGETPIDLTEKNAANQTSTLLRRSAEEKAAALAKGNTQPG